MHCLLVLTSVLVALCCSIGSVDSSAYDKIVSHSRIRARKEGPNVCAMQRVLGTNKKYFSTCRNWYKGSICGKKTEVLYECCPGYMKLEGMRGCPSVNSTIFSDLPMSKSTVLLLFPHQWLPLTTSMKLGISWTLNVNIELYNALHFHMVNRRLLTKDMKDSLSVTSMYNDQGLYFNHYSNGIVTVNCARIIHGNQVATNGVVHVIDRVISAVGNTIKDHLEIDDDLISFSTAALASGLMDKLGQPGHYTVFAPTNEAFEKLSPGYLERIMNDKDVIAALVNYHLLNSVQCGEAIMAGSVHETAEGSNIEIGCDGNTLTVNGIKMVLKKDIVATNGVIHLIDEVLVPNSAKEVMELVGESQTKFSDMVSELGLAAALGPKTEYTLLAPVNDAFTDEVMSTDHSLLRSILEEHILKLKITLSELYNGQLLETLAGKLLRVFIYRTAVCIENACMMRGSREGSNGALHVMNTLIKPADQTMHERLVSDGRFKIFLSLMETAGLEDVLKQEGSYTVFAPTDDAFDGLTRDDFDLLKSDLNALRTILLYHLSNGIFINGGLQGGVTNLLRSLQGTNLQVLSVNNSIHVNSVAVPDSDLMATNGVIHVVRTVLYPADLPVGRQDLFLLLKKLIRYITIKFVSGYTYTEIPLTFISKVIENKPTITKVTRVIKAEPVVTTMVVEGEPVITKVTKVIEAEPPMTKVTRVIGTDTSRTKVRVGQRQPGVTKVTRVIEGPDFSRITTIHGNPKLLEEESERITQIIKGEK
uniref:Periostin n=1 Tax=Gouania willdenowi TaxID=441366 RepID=A0A8C5GZ35_GOUWI